MTDRVDYSFDLDLKNRTLDHPSDRKEIHYLLEEFDQLVTGGTAEHKVIYRKAPKDGINVFLMSDRVDDIKEESHDIFSPTIPEEYQNDNNIFIFTPPTKNIPFTIDSRGHAKHFRLIEVHDATKFLKSSLCGIMTETEDKEYFAMG